MLLLRGFGSEVHARQIEQGIVGCRDVASILLDGIGETGYQKSNYHEKLLQQTLFGVQGRIPELHSLPSRWARLLRIALDPLLARSYLTYFHIFDPRVTQQWLENCWDDDSYFIFIEPYFELEAYNCIAGSGYCGAPVTYVKTHMEIDPRETLLKNPALLVLLDNEMAVETPNEERAQYVNDMLTLSTILFNRIEERKFNRNENEFRIFARDPRRLSPNGLYLRDPINIEIRCDDEIFYLHKDPTNSTPAILSDSEGVPQDLLETAWSNRDPCVTSQFGELNISDTSLRYGYIGNREECVEFVKEVSSGSLESFPGIHHGNGQDVPEERSLKNVLTDFADIDGEGSGTDAIVVKPNGKGCVSLVGPGYKESNFPNPLELGLTDPHQSFTSALKFLVGTDYPDDTAAFPQDHSREFLHSSIDPWVPVTAMRRIASKRIASELAFMKNELVELRQPVSLPPFSSSFSIARIKKRLEKNITYEGVERSLERTASLIDIPLDSDTYAKVRQSALSGFDESKASRIDQTLDRLPRDYEKLLQTMRRAKFEECDEGAIAEFLENGDGIVAVYELDLDAITCQCDKCHQCDDCIALTLSPSTLGEGIDLSKFSYAIGPKVVWEDDELGAAYAICQTVLNTPDSESESFWNISCAMCPKIAPNDVMAIRLTPKKIICCRNLDTDQRNLISKELPSSIGIERD